MSEFTIYHNPRCSKSRQTLALLEENGHTPIVIEYLKTPPSVTVLQELLQKLKCKPDALLRKKEAEYKSLKLEGQSDAALLKAMHEHPKLIERPIVVKGKKAVIGRPPENVESLL